MNAIQHAIDLAGGPVALTREMNKRIERPVTYQAVLKWARQGRLPRTDWTGETSYAKAIAASLGGRIKVRELLVREPVAEVVETETRQAAALTHQAQEATETVAQGAAHG